MQTSFVVLLVVGFLGMNIFLPSLNGLFLGLFLLGNIILLPICMALLLRHFFAQPALPHKAE